MGQLETRLTYSTGVTYLTRQPKYIYVLDRSGSGYV